MTTTGKGLWSKWTGDPMQNPELSQARRMRRRRQMEQEIMHQMAMRMPSGAATTRFDPTGQVAAVTQSELSLCLKQPE